MGGGLRARVSIVAAKEPLFFPGVCYIKLLDVEDGAGRVFH